MLREGGLGRGFLLWLTGAQFARLGVPCVALLWRKGIEWIWRQVRLRLTFP